MGARSRRDYNRGVSPRVLATRDAIEEIKAWKQRESRPEAVFRIDVRLGGCRGFKLFFDLEEAAESDDILTEFDGVKVVVQEDGLPLIDGSVLDFEDSYRGRGFRLANPNARNACGCGTSFMADYPDGASSSLDGGEDQIVAGAAFSG
jgi:iron-sulfur cluster insertion protein